jgi:hypothetical protein
VAIIIRDVNADLSADEFAILRQLSKSFARGTVSSDISKRLRALGYAAELMGNLILTDRGSAKLAMGEPMSNPDA